MSVSVVIAAFNEAENLGYLIDEVGTALRGIDDWEVVVVDDGSSDETPRRVAELAHRERRLRWVRHRRNAGQSAALVTGVRLARHPLIATLDGDGQNDPADIPALLAAFRAEADPLLLVVGERRRRRDSALRRLSSRVANRVRRALLDDDCPDTGCGLKVFAREAFLELPRFDHMHRFLPALFKRAGGRVLNVPVNHRPRRAGESKYGVHNRLWVGLVDLLGVIWLARRPCRPQVDGGER